MPNEVEANNHKDLKEKEKKHDSGAADLEKVTDYAEEKEIGSSSAAEDAIAVISKILYMVCYNLLLNTILVCFQTINRWKKPLKESPVKRSWPKCQSKRKMWS